MFAHKLGLVLGKSLKEIGRMSSWEFSSWKAYDLVQPFGEPAMDLRFGIISQMYASAHQKKNTPKVKLSSFLLSEISRKASNIMKSSGKQTVSHQKNLLKEIFKAFSGKKKKKKKKRKKA